MKNGSNVIILQSSLLRFWHDTLQQHLKPAVGYSVTVYESFIVHSTDHTVTQIVGSKR